MSVPRVLDLFCGAGGVSVGLQRAGFNVTGVDIRPQPRYRGGTFIQADALTFPLDGYDFVWASPPCQAYTSARFQPPRNGKPRKDHPDLVAPVRERLAGSGAAWVIENVPGAPLRSPVVVCGLALGLRVKRHRLFESNLLLLGTECPPGHPGDWMTVYGTSGGGPKERAYRPRRATPREARVCMGIDWMNRYELSQAIPPAYAEWIGRQALVALRATP